MKLLIVLSIIAYGYADKLDRAYLPPVNAATAGGSPGALIAPGSSSGSRLPGSNSGQVDFGQGLPTGRQPATGSVQSRPSAFGGVSGSTPSGPGFGTGINQGLGGINQGTSGINQYPSGSGSNALVAAGGNGKIPLLGANAPIGTSQGQSFGNNFNPVANTFNVGSQQTYGTQAGGPSGQGFNQGTQAFNTAQAYKPERAQAAADRNAEILKYVNENNGESYLYSYETSNGISAEESGVATNGVKAQGGFSYTGDDGQAYSLTYTADENGFQPQGEHLPTPHPIPEEILKSIEENSRAAAAGTQEGAYRPEEYESEDSFNQYNFGQGSFNRPQGQSQSTVQGSFPQGTQGQINQFSENQATYGPNRVSGQSGQYVQPITGQGSNQFGAGFTGFQGQINQYQQGSGSSQGLLNQFPGQSVQIGNVKPSQGSSQFNTKPQGQSNQYQTGVGSGTGSNGIQGQVNQYQQGIGSNQGLASQLPGQSVQFGNVKPSQGQSNQYQTSAGSSQGPFGQSSSQGSISQGPGQFPSSGYSYKQPQNAFGPATQLGLGSSVQNRPQANQGQISSTANNQGNFGLQSGKLPLSETPFGSSQGPQYGQSQNFINKPGNQPTGTAGIFGQGQQNQLNINKPFFESSQTRPGNQGSPGLTGSSGYQYQANANRPTVGLNKPSGSSFQTGQGSQNQLNANKPSFGANTEIKGTAEFGATGNNGQIGQAQQYPQNGNRPFGPPTTGGNSGFNQGSSPFGGTSGIKKTGSGSSLSQANPSYGSSTGPSQSSSQFGLGGQQSTPAQGSLGSKGSAPGQAPYQYNRPSQSFPTQQQSGVGPSGIQGFSGQRPGSSSFGSQGVNAQKPGVSFQGSQDLAGQRPGLTSPGSQDINGQQPSYNSQESQSVNGRPGSAGTQGVNGQRPDGIPSGPQGENGQRPGSFSGSQDVVGKRPTFTGTLGLNQRPDGSSPGFQGRPPVSSGPSQGIQGRPEQFGGPRQPPSFSPQEGYKY